MLDSHLPITRLPPRQLYVTTSEELLFAVVGASVCICVRDTEVGIAGVCQFMLPMDKLTIDNLLHEIIQHGGRRENLEFKLYGGADTATSLDVGAQSAQYARDYLHGECFKIREQDVGGDMAREVYYGAWSGRVQVQRVSRRANERIFDQEKHGSVLTVPAHTAFPVDLAQVRRAAVGG
jgi:chemotaxis protein CheD